MTNRVEHFKKQSRKKNVCRVRQFWNWTVSAEVLKEQEKPVSSDEVNEIFFYSDVV